MKSIRTKLTLVCLCILHSAFCLSAIAQGSGFTYQGQLSDGGTPTSGIYDLRFTIYDSTNNPGVVIAGPLTNSAVNISNGLFTVLLDFGPGVFTGAERWLGVGVRASGPGTFATLTPRQRLTAAPYAITASNLSGTLPASKLTGTIAPANIANGSLTGVMLANGAVASNHLAAAAVTTPALADGAVTSAKVFNSFVVLSTVFTNPAPFVADQFGKAVATVGGNILVGAPLDDTGSNGAGAAYLFDTAGTLLVTYTNPTPAANDSFGSAVAGVGTDKVLICANSDDTGADNAGIAYLYNTSGALLLTLTNPSPAVADFFGSAAIAVGSRHFLIGSSIHNPGQIGAAYLYDLSGQLVRTFTNPTPGNLDFFGGAVAAVGTDKVLIGAPSDDAGTTNAGVAYLLGTNGTLLVTYTNPAPLVDDQFGFAVATVGQDKVLIGAPQDDTGATDAGSAYLYDLNGALLQTFTNPAPQVTDQFGFAVAAVGNDRVLIAAYFDNAGEVHTGTAYLFDLAGNLISTFTNPAPFVGDQFGYSVAALDANRVVIGVPMDDAGAADAGVAYLIGFDRFTPGLTADRVRAGSVGSASLADGAVTSAKIAPASITTTMLVDGAVGANQLANGAVGANQLSNGAVGTNQLADGAVTASKLATGSVSTTKIADGTIGTADLSAAVLDSTFWKLSGNTGTTPAAQFLGTTDNQPLEIRVNSALAVRFEPGTTPNLIGGRSNLVVAGHVGVVVAGGADHLIDADFATIGGGRSNVVNNLQGTVGGGVFNRAGGGLAATVSGGFSNIAGGFCTTVGGGRFNTAIGFVSGVSGGQGNTVETNADHSVISGGLNNLIERFTFRGVIAGGGGNQIGTNSDYSTISGGLENHVTNNSGYATIAGGSANDIDTGAHLGVISGGYGNKLGPGATYSAIGGGAFNLTLSNSSFATIPGGLANTATNQAFAAGTRAKANHNGAFVWADSQDVDFSSTTTNQFNVRANGGVRFVTAGAAMTLNGQPLVPSGNFIFAYESNSVSIAIANVFQDITFSTDDSINGWTHTPGTATYTNTQTGLYLIQYTGIATTSVAGGISISIRASLNGSALNASMAGVNVSTSGLGSDIARSFIASINAGDTLKLQLRASSINASLSGALGPSASMTITRIQ